MRQSFRIKSNIIEAMDGRISAYILAGGKSSRMGTEKGLVLFRGKPLIQHLILTLLDLGLSPVLIAQHPDYQQFGVPVMGDLVPDKGPLGGIYTALTHCESDHALILSCDSPLLRSETLKKWIESPGNSIQVGQSGERVYPFPGIYPKSFLPQVMRYLEENKLRVQGFILDHRHQMIPLDQVSSQPEVEFANFNSPNDPLFWEQYEDSIKPRP